MGRFWRHDDRAAEVEIKSLQGFSRGDPSGEADYSTRTKIKRMKSCIQAQRKNTGSFQNGLVASVFCSFL